MIARSFARIHRQNLVNYGILPLTFVDADDYDKLASNTTLTLDGLHGALDRGDQTLTITADGAEIRVRHDLTDKQRQVIRAGGLVNWRRERLVAG